MADEKNVVSTSTKNVYQKLIEARASFLAAGVKKSGINRFQKFDYFELQDIVPAVTSIFNNLGLVFITSFTNEVAKGVLINTENPTEVIEVTSPMRELGTISKEGNEKMNALQGLGAEETYQRRYLYFMIMDIVECDTFDGSIGKPTEESTDDGLAQAPAKVKVTKTKNKPVTTEEREEIKDNLINKDGEATKVQIDSIKEGLKQLRASGSDNEAYIGSVVAKIRAGITKKEADDLLIEIGDKLEG